ncbi:MAG TPA: hypothetical protein VHT73_18780, partial [Thermodesulfobacteriota bacterium]|nr:hypothetical protein [Thermodesulfobacteriota bacterium]
GSVVHISLAKENATQSNLLKLKGVVEAYPGESQIHLHLETNGGEAVVELGDFRVDICDEFIEEVERLFGSRALRLG